VKTLLKLGCPCLKEMLQQENKEIQKKPLCAKRRPHGRPDDELPFKAAQRNGANRALNGLIPSGKKKGLVGRGNC